jgi:hypothetical protein
MDPAPVFASPPLTAHVTDAAPPPLGVAENCSTAKPEELVVLQPVQLVSIATVPGEMDSVPPPPPPPPEADPPQPASTNKAGTTPAASNRAGHCRRE